MDRVDTHQDGFLLLLWMKHITNFILERCAATKNCFVDVVGDDSVVTFSSSFFVFASLSSMAFVPSSFSSSTGGRCDKQHPCALDRNTPLPGHKGCFSTIQYVVSSGALLLLLSTTRTMVPSDWHWSHCSLSIKCNLVVPLVGLQMSCVFSV